jgi:hypothetical protein
VPAREGCQEHEGEEGEDNSHDKEVREDNGVLECRCDPHEVEGILVDVQVVHERSGVVGADVATTVPVDANTEVADADTKLGVADDVRDSLSDTGIDLFRSVGGSVLFVPQRDEEDAWDEW